VGESGFSTDIPVVFGDNGVATMCGGMDAETVCRLR